MCCLAMAVRRCRDEGLYTGRGGWTPSRFAGPVQAGPSPDCPKEAPMDTPAFPLFVGID